MVRDIARQPPLGRRQSPPVEQRREPAAASLDFAAEALADNPPLHGQLLPDDRGQAEYTLGVYVDSPVIQ